MEEKIRAKIEQKTLDYFNSGYNCAEAISKAILEHYSNGAHSDIPNAATVFGGGIGASKGETCGALNGGIVAIGCLLGRRQPGDDKKAAYELGAEFRLKFIDQFGSSACRTILEGFGEQENCIECKKLTARAAGILFTVLGQTIPDPAGKA